MARLKSCWFLLCHLVALAWTASMRLPSYPLAVKTPYLSVWLPGHLSHDFPSATPQFWKGQELTWIVLARIDSITYCLLGCTGGRAGTVPASQKSLNFTATHTYVFLEAGPANVTLDFFSPVDPIDHVRQSLPYSYLTVSAKTTASTEHDISILTAIDSSWISTRGRPFVRSQTVNGSRILTLNGEQGREFSENTNMALWGDVVLATKDDGGLSITSCQAGSPQGVFGSFVQTGDLTDFIGTMEHDNLAACSQSISAAKHKHKHNTTTATFAIGLHQDKAIQYNDGNSTTHRAAYFRSKIANVTDAVTHFFNDFKEASVQSQTLDDHIRTIGAVTSSNYSDLLEFAVRQCFAGQQVTIPYDTLNTSHPYAFIKEISTNGNTNTLADLIPKALPIFHVLNPEYTRMFIEPVLRFSLKAWPLNHAIHDIGKHYPNATGETPCIEEFLPLDSTSVLLWMLYLYQNTTGDTDLTTTYSTILEKYADYCYRYGLFPVTQRSSVDALGSAPNQTALSVSAAIALNAYGEMTGQSIYSKYGVDFAEKIIDIGTDANRTHFMTHYTDDEEAWVLMYPLAFDAWLGLETFPSWLYERLSNWYSDHKLPYGVQYRNSLRYTLMEWQMWVAATVSNSLRDHLVDAVHMFLSHETGPRDSVPGPTQWVVIPGEDEGRWTYMSKAKSVIGSIYMIAAVQGGFNNSYAKTPSQSRTSPLIVPSLADPVGLTLQDPNTLNFEYLEIEAASDLTARYDIPYDVPLGASKPVSSSFLGLSFDTASFPKYVGNLSTPNYDARVLIRNLITAADSMFTVRVGSPEGDNGIFDPIQPSPLDRVNISGTPTLSIGPSFFDSIRTLEGLGRIEWTYQVPFAPYDIYNAVQGAMQAVDAIPNQRLFALEIGHKANKYAGVARADNYDCQFFSAEMFQFKHALRQNIGRIGNQFQALGLSHSRIDESWTMEECFTVGVKAQDDLRTIAVHYSQLESNSELKSSRIPRHSAIKEEHEIIVPQANYLRDIYPCHPFVISEATLVSTDADDYSTVEDTFNQQNSLELGLWNLDFLLYAMSHNISRVQMHQSCDSASSAWTPSACRHSDAASDNTTRINGPYYALTFVASFVSGANNFQVVPIQESEDTIVYAGYESGKLSKIAVVNYPPEEDSEQIASSTEKTITLKVSPEIRHLHQRARISSSSIELGGVTLAERALDVPKLQQILLDREGFSVFSIDNEVLSITLNGGEALLFEVLG